MGEDMSMDTTEERKGNNMGRNRCIPYDNWLTMRFNIKSSLLWIKYIITCPRWPSHLPKRNTQKNKKKREIYPATSHNSIRGIQGDKIQKEQKVSPPKNIKRIPSFMGWLKKTILWFTLFAGNNLVYKTIGYKMCRDGLETKGFRLISTKGKNLQWFE